jgi:hypothetical protein
MTVFLHVGFPKTGTTSIQRTMRGNADSLRDTHSINYPEINHPGIKSNHWPFALPFLEEQKKYPLYDHALKMKKGGHKDFIRAADNALRSLQQNYSKYKYHVLSSEGFCALNEQTSRNFLDYFKQNGMELRIILYVRHPALQISSRFSRNVKSGAKGLKDIDNLSNFVEPQLKRLVAVYGKDNIIVRRFGNQYFINDDLIDDFTYTVCGEKITNIKKISHNESLSTPALLILDQLNEIAPRFDRSRGSYKYITKIKGPKFLAPRDIVRRYVEKHQTFLEYLNSDFNIDFDDVDYDQFPTAIDRELSEETIRSIAEILNKQSRKIDGLSHLIERAFPLQRFIDFVRRK